MYGFFVGKKNLISRFYLPFFFFKKKFRFELFALKCEAFHIDITIYKNMVVFDSRALEKQIRPVCFLVGI